MKKLFILTFCTLCISLPIFSQEVVLHRISDLMPRGYAIEGDAFLEELSDGVLNLRLSDDFSTPRGPDVRILLSNELSLNGAVEIVNLTTINHFNGGITLQVPDSIQIDDFDFILFFCVQFNQFWASGTFGEASIPNDGSGFMCQESIVSLFNGNQIGELCPTDSRSDSVSFINSLGASSENYAYLITDENEILQAVVEGNIYDFDGSGSAIQRVYGIHFEDTLNPAIGENRLQTTASGCFTHSAAKDFVTIRKTGFCFDTFECMNSLTATTDWVTVVDICSNDSLEDLIPLKNNLFIPPGEHYAYLITDTNEIVQEVVQDSVYNFEGSEASVRRVYGIHFDGTLDAAIGSNRLETTATGCYTHSGGNLFLTINTTAGCMTTSLKPLELLEQGIDIFPNPSHGTFSIRYGDNADIKQVRIFGARGELIKESGPLDQVSCEKSGIYIVQFVSSNKQSISRKILVW